MFGLKTFAGKKKVFIKNTNKSQQHGSFKAILKGNKSQHYVVCILNFIEVNKQILARILKQTYNFIRLPQKEFLLYNCFIQVMD